MMPSLVGTIIMTFEKTSTLEMFRNFRNSWPKGKEAEVDTKVF